MRVMRAAQARARPSMRAATEKAIMGPSSAVPGSRLGPRAPRDESGAWVAAAAHRQSGKAPIGMEDEEAGSSAVPRWQVVGVLGLFGFLATVILAFLT